MTIKTDRVTHDFFLTFIENDNCAVSGLFRMKIGRKEYNMGRKIEGKNLIFIYDHC